MRGIWESVGPLIPRSSPRCLVSAAAAAAAAVASDADVIACCARSVAVVAVVQLRCITDFPALADCKRKRRLLKVTDRRQEPKKSCFSFQHQPQ